MKQLFHFRNLGASLAVAAMSLAFSAPAQAIVYDFKHIGNTYADGSKLLVEVTENLTTPENDVLFRFTNDLPVLNPAKAPSISFIYFDTGSYASLFAGISVMDSMPSSVETSPGVLLVQRSVQNHPFLPGLSVDYRIGLSTTYPFDRPEWGVNPGGEYAVLSAMLNTGFSYNDVITAMNEGLSSSTGLRIGELIYFINGTGLDDGGFVTKGIAPVPEAESWAMMLAGLGLIGFMARRRKV
jgi:MYXO-CTERM domain-containing protein